MCWTQAQSALVRGGTPPMARESWAQVSAPQFFSENGGLATTTSKVARVPSGLRRPGLRRVSPRTI